MIGTDLSSAQTPDDEFSGERSSDRLLVVEYRRHFDRRGQCQHLRTGDVVLAQVEYDEVGVAVERVLAAHTSLIVNVPSDWWT